MEALRQALDELVATMQRMGVWKRSKIVEITASGIEESESSGGGNIKDTIKDGENDDGSECAVKYSGNEEDDARGPFLTHRLPLYVLLEEEIYLPWYFTLRFTYDILWRVCVHYMLLYLWQACSQFIRRLSGKTPSHKDNHQKHQSVMHKIRRPEPWCCFRVLMHLVCILALQSWWSTNYERGLWAAANGNVKGTMARALDLERGDFEEWWVRGVDRRYVLGPKAFFMVKRFLGWVTG